MDRNKRVFRIEDTKFIFATNFQGDPQKDRFHSGQRKANIIIPDEALAEEMRDYGINVRQTRPRDENDPDFVPTYYVSALVNYRCPDRFKPRIYIVSGDNDPVLLDEESVGTVDDMWVDNVNVTLSTNEYDDGKFSLYVQTMYIEQRIEDDPFASRYQRRNG